MNSKVLKFKRRLSREQRIRDPVHNLIKFSPSSEDDEVLWDLLQTSWMQRLRRIKQLGFSDFVFPGAGHTRFSHSLGALQMARRMLDVFESKGLIDGKSDEEHRLMKKATLCAVLLHDVGHGPYSHVFESVSHVFEDVSKALGKKQTHEGYTRQILSDGEIKRILTSQPNSPELHCRVINFFDQESGSDQYSRIVSSQLDADRLDFLIRDRYFCGVQFGAIDLEWLLDSIEIETIRDPENSDVSPYTFCFSEKGKTVAEDFVMAYVNMYRNVYYHKAVDALETMVVEILKGIYGQGNQNKWRENDPLAEYFHSDPSDPKDELDKYGRLDDSSVIEAIKWASCERGLGEAHELSKRFFERDIFKAMTIHPEDYTKIYELETGLEEKGIWYKSKKSKPKGFKEYPFGEEGYLKNLWIMKSGKPVTLHRESDIVRMVKENPPVRFYFKNAEDCCKAVEMGKNMGMKL